MPSQENQSHPGQALLNGLHSIAATISPITSITATVRPTTASGLHVHVYERGLLYCATRQRHHFTLRKVIIVRHVVGVIMRYVGGVFIRHVGDVIMRHVGGVIARQVSGVITSGSLSGCCDALFHHRALREPRLFF